MSDGSDPGGRPVEYIVAEYEAAQALFQHYDGFRWQAGSMLMAGAFVFLGLLSTNGSGSGTLALGSSIVAVVLSCWILFAHHYRQLYMFKVDRIVELETVMGAEQNRRFNPPSNPTKVYPRFGPRGHTLDLVVYIVMGLGGPGLATARDGWSAWLIPAVVIVIITAAVVVVNDRRLLRWLAENRTQTPSTSQTTTT